MDDNETIEHLEHILHVYDILEIDAEIMRDIIDHLQRRVDIIAAAENKEPFTENEMPYVYKLSRHMRKQAHIELDCAIAFEDMEDCFDKALHYGKLARRHIEQYTEWVSKKV